jgi:hypothetical protein
MPAQRVLVPDRLRRPPATGWSWVDRLFLRQYADRLSQHAILLYFGLAAVSDKHGMSFYADVTLATLFRMTLPELVEAREELLALDLIAHEVRFTQVLCLPTPRTRRAGSPVVGVTPLGEILRQMIHSTHDTERDTP